MKLNVLLTTIAITVSTGAFLHAQDAAPAVKPPVIKNLKLWLAAEAGVTKDETGNVTAWTSQVEPKVELKQENGSMYPLYRKDALNGKPALSFNGTASAVVAELPAGFEGDITVFVVWGSSMEQVSLVQDGGNNRILSATHEKGADYVTGFQLGTGSKEIAKPSIKVGEFKTRPKLKYLAVGGMLNSETGMANGFNMTGDVAEVLLYTEALPAADKEAVTKYLQDKYGIAQKQ
ncbi:MAG: hypothetical protein WAX69_04180 [Victivallales bacterium]